LEASKEAIDVASKKLPGNVTFMNGTFEQITLVEKFDTIVMTHVLEHLDAPLDLLNKIKRNWLAPGGLLLITVPNANAISRQIAVEMGIVEYTTCVTESEFIHGHRATYDFESLSKLINQSDLKNVFQTGIFFKALANFQWDQILEQKIVSPEFLEASLKIGRKYPDLCSSLFVVCKNVE
jgi:2-polyprenyl-3-methyl-5-hydroxy-6-metoxy-1,4-benzoquinol methylase